MREYDVAVVGGGPGGVPAAVASARRGARTALFERYGYLGGMATAGLVNPYMGYWAGKKPIIRGIFAEMLDELRRRGGLGEDGQTFDEEILKGVLDRLVLEAGVEVFFHCTFGGCRADGGRIESAQFASKGGMFEARAAVFVDAAGDGDVAAAGGAQVEIGRAADGLCQPMTLCFRVAGIDGQAFGRSHARTIAALNEAYLAAKEAGTVENPREDVLVFKTLRDGVLHFNTTRVTGKSPVSPEELSEAEFEGRRQAYELVELFRAKVRGFENAYISKMGALIGVRESRRVMGGYVLTVEDVLGARKFDDAIACSRYPIDIHNPAGTGTVIREVPEGDWYEIPYRALVPSGVENLVMASRSISATHEAHSSLRVMPVVAAIGEAAGAAAAMSANAGRKPSEVDAAELRKSLREAGAFEGEGA